MKIALATDHTGFELMSQLKESLKQNGYYCVDFSPDRFTPTDDYPDFIIPAARAVATGECDMGIIMGGSGQGEAMAANRIKGIRCSVYYGPATPIGSIDINATSASDEYEIVRLSRTHNNANILSLAARFVTPEEMKKVVDIWLTTPFENVERHLRRIIKLDEC